MGYYVSVYPNLKSDIYVLLEQDLKYTPKLNIYNLRTGEQSIVKVKKDKFLNNNSNKTMLDLGDVFTIKSEHYENSMKLVDGKWEINKDFKWRFIDKVVRIRKEGN